MTLFDAAPQRPTDDAHPFRESPSGLCECGRHVGDPVHSHVYPLYGGTPPHVDGDTSTDAAVAARPNVARMHAALLDLFARRPDWTCDELEEATGFTHQSCSARVRELVLLGRILDSGRRRETRSGRKARIYQPVEAL